MNLSDDAEFVEPGFAWSSRSYKQTKPRGERELGGNERDREKDALALGHSRCHSARETCVSVYARANGQACMVTVVCYPIFSGFSMA